MGGPSIRRARDSDGVPTSDASRFKTAAPVRGAASSRLLSLGALSSGIVRDVNDALCAMIGWAQLLEDELAPDSKAANYARQVTRAGRHAARTNARLLAYAERPEGEVERMDLRGVVDYSTELVGHLVDDIRVDVVHCTGALPVEGVVGEIEHVVIALVLGAHDAMPGGGRLSMTTNLVADVKLRPDRPRASWAHLEVRDTGAPLPNAGEPGAGLGQLREMVERQGGVLRVSSHGLDGSVVDVFLPAAEPGSLS